METDMNVELKREMLYLMRHPETAWYGSVMLLGKTEIDPDCKSAYTNGRDTYIGKEFFARLSRGQRRLLILHELFHKAYMHVPYYRQYWKKNPTLTNIAADFVVNGMAMSFNDKTLVEPIEGMFYDPKYHGWSVPEVYRDLEEEEKEGGGGGSGGKGNPLDEHDFSQGEGDGEGEGENGVRSRDESLEKDVEEALRQGGMLAGKLGQPVPRALHDALEPKVDWRAVLAVFVTSTVKGRDEGTWQKYNRKWLADRVLLPSTHKESMTELVVAIDLSGSINDLAVNEFAAELCSICEGCMPDKVRVLWWDTEVRSEQVFTEDYTNLRDMLKPQGGGGTNVSCVSKYLNDNRIKPDAIVVLTDGYVEDKIEWGVSSPTLWMVTQNRDFVPPSGGAVVKVQEV
jgi:predicted metal-dependent peptidase